MLPPAAEIPDAWAITIAPAPIVTDDDPSARPVVALVTAGDLAVHVDLMARGPAELEPLAREVVRVLDAGIANAGKAPDVVVVEHEGLSQLLSPLLVARSIAVLTADRSAEAERAMAALMQHLAPDLLIGRIEASHGETWASWDWPADVTARLHAAAAGYFRAAPWRQLASDQLLAIRHTESGAVSHAVVLGEMGELWGLALYDSLDDVLAKLRVREAEDVPRARQLVMSLAFSAGDDLPAAMRREVRAAEWEVAGRTAWPDLIAHGSPGGGVTVADAERLIVALREIPLFVERHRTALRHEQAVTTPIAEPGVLPGVELENRGFLDAWAPPLWRVPEELSVCGAVGEGCTPGAPLPEMSDEMATEWIEEMLPQILAHPRMRTNDQSRDQFELHQAVAEGWLRFVALIARVSAPGLAELHLRQFLYEVVPVTWPWEPDVAFLGALRRVLEVQQATAAVRYPWADALLEDLAACRTRWLDCPNPDASDEYAAWRDQLMADLEQRLLVPYPDDDTWTYWGGFDDGRNGALARRLAQAWLGWRDALIATGTTNGDSLDVLLRDRQRRWFATPQAELDGRTPIEALTAPTPKRRRARRKSR